MLNVLEDRIYLDRNVRLYIVTGEEDYMRNEVFLCPKIQTDE